MMFRVLVALQPTPSHSGETIKLTGEAEDLCEAQNKAMRKAHKENPNRGVTLLSAEAVSE